MPADKKPVQKAQRATYMTLMGIFASLFGVVSLTRGKQLELKPLDLALLGLATYRSGHLVSYDKVTEEIRKPFTETKPDGSGAGTTVVPKGAGVQKALGELISCPICAGTWMAALMVYGLLLLPGPTRVFMAIMSATGIAEWLNSSGEAMKWSSLVARNEVGAKQN